MVRHERGLPVDALLERWQQSARTLVAHVGGGRSSSTSRLGRRTALGPHAGHDPSRGDVDPHRRRCRRARRRRSSRRTDSSHIARLAWRTLPYAFAQAGAYSQRTRLLRARRDRRVPRGASFPKRTRPRRFGATASSSASWLLGASSPARPASKARVPTRRPCSNWCAPTPEPPLLRSLVPPSPGSANVGQRDAADHGQTGRDHRRRGCRRRCAAGRRCIRPAPAPRRRRRRRRRGDARRRRATTTTTTTTTTDCSGVRGTAHPPGRARQHGTERRTSVGAGRQRRAGQHVDGRHEQRQHGHDRRARDRGPARGRAVARVAHVLVLAQHPPDEGGRPKPRPTSSQKRR